MPWEPKAVSLLSSEDASLSTFNHPSRDNIPNPAPLSLRRRCMVTDLLRCSYAEARTIIPETSVAPGFKVVSLRAWNSLLSNLYDGSNNLGRLLQGLLGKFRFFL